MKAVLFLIGVAAALDCKPGFKKSVDGSCSAYAVCVAKGNWSIGHCQPGYRFDPDEKICKLGPCVDDKHSGTTHNDDKSKTDGCKGGTKQVVDLKKAVYKECVKGIFLEKKCSPEERLDAETISCVKVEAKVVCNEGDKESSSECSSYKICKLGQWVKQSCGFLHTFNPNTRECQLGFTCTEKSKMASEPCRAGDMAEYDSDPECVKYWECREGQWVERRCKMGTTFDINQNKCVLGEACSPLELRSGTGCSGNTSLDVVHSDKLCEHFWSCQGGKWTQRRCNRWEVFNPNTERCEYGSYCIPKDELVGTPCTVGDVQIVDEDKWCQLYRTCPQGRWEPASCDFEHVFNPLRKKCQRGRKCLTKEDLYPSNHVTTPPPQSLCNDPLSRHPVLGSCGQFLVCGEDSVEVRTCPKDTPFFSSGGCATSSNCQDGAPCSVPGFKMPVSAECSGLYYSCEQTSSFPEERFEYVLKQCDDGFFDQDTCVPKDQSSCRRVFWPATTRTTTPPTTTTTIKPTASTIAKNFSRPVDTALCDKKQIQFSVPGECSLYLFCFNNNVFLGGCDPTLFFDPVTQDCVEDLDYSQCEPWSRCSDFGATQQVSKECSGNYYSCDKVKQNLLWSLHSCPAKLVYDSRTHSCQTRIKAACSPTDVSKLDPKKLRHTEEDELE